MYLSLNRETLMNFSDYLGVSAKYCHGFHVSPKSVDLSRANTPGLGELPILMKT